ncbi:MAG: hypothetical protein RJB38_2144 [Pseudomonadota bacterium]|jgi:signal transduction histidine kinase/putative methionine-R-sulfoxide reductase with GAF domain
MAAETKNSSLAEHLQSILCAAVEVASADHGTIQLLEPDGATLSIAAHFGFTSEWLEFWNEVTTGDGTCGTAMREGRRIIVEDVEKDSIFRNSAALKVQLKARVRAIQSTPITSRSGKLIGMLSTHYRKPGRPDERTLRIIDLLTDQAAAIIELHTADEALRKTMQLFTQAQEIGNLGYWEWKIPTNQVTWSEQLYRIYGLDPDRTKPTLSQFRALLHPDDRQLMEDNMASVVNDGTAIDIDFRIIRPDGAIRFIWTRGSVLSFTKDRKPDLASGINQDVTDRKILEEELQKAIEVRDEFLSIASHELRTPLAALHMQLQLLQRHLTKTASGADQKLAQFAEKACRSSEALSVLLSELMDVTRIRAGRLSFAPSEVDLSELTQEAISRHRSLADAAGSTISFDCKQSPISGTWDKNRLNQVLSNLLSNAIKYGDGKPISVRVDSDPAKGYARLEVADQGIGIPVEMQSKIFERFQRAISGDQITGLGLGLYIASEIVKGHGGTIDVESTLGKGSRFVVQLPLKHQ